MEMHFRREMDALPAVLAMSEEFCRLNDVEGANRDTVAFILEELFTNAVKYGSRVAGQILIVLDRHHGNLQLSLTDFDADRFDIRETPEVDIDLPLEGRTPGGLGIHLVKKFADQIEYEYHDRISKTTIIKELE